MGASSSSEQNVSREQREVETVAASMGALPMLQKAFSKLADPETSTVPLENLQKCFSVAYKEHSYAGNIPDSLPVLLDHLSSSVVDQFFLPAKGGVSWIEFVKGYNKCCERMSVSMSLTLLVRVFLATERNANMPLDLEIESNDVDCKINGSFLPIHVLLLLLMCWVMSWDCRNLKHSEGKGIPTLPDLNHLVLSAITSCAKLENNLNVWDSNISNLEVQLSTGKFVTWVSSTVPCLPDILRQYFHSRLQTLDELVPPNSFIGDTSSTTECDHNILTHGRAWGISLTQKNAVNEEILRACFPSSGDKMDDNLLYRSSTHGRGLNRFWSCVEGYKGALLILVAANSGDVHEGGSNDRKWVVGALTDQSFENKDMFYGSSGCLYAISPVFHVFPSTGKDKNFVYSHLHPTGRVYEPHPKPVGIAFGGTLGNERIFIDEDFARVTVRHHAVDKTYQNGSLVPAQGFLPIEALISEVEVWGLGGKEAKAVQNSHKKREELFTEQRRKVDLKTFASWEDSPENMMMEMMSNPNAVRREDR
ncbi:hypothetical protein L6164_025034 [Bauhinia variegata]|uniref:Uncharacterized protein n=1 Tax=Bauhinia variegata TaxID=167791 RepID=A0ACB9M2E1_BAUVA|nr:hypothetical protein L6164_025034 [Bauhinia variegata]